MKTTDKSLIAITLVLLMVLFNIPIMSFAAVTVYTPIGSFGNLVANGEVSEKIDTWNSNATYSAPTGKMISYVIIHAGDGQTLYKIDADTTPAEEAAVPYMEVRFLNNRTQVTVKALDNAHGISFVGLKYDELIITTVPVTTTTTIPEVTTTTIPEITTTTIPEVTTTTVPEITTTTVPEVTTTTVPEVTTTTIPEVTTTTIPEVTTTTIPEVTTTTVPEVTTTTIPEVTTTTVPEVTTTTIPEVTTTTTNNEEETTTTTTTTTTTDEDEEETTTTTTAEEETTTSVEDITETTGPLDVPDVNVPEEIVPLALATLPKTGELPVSLFYGLGGLMTAVGLFIKRK